VLIGLAACGESGGDSKYVENCVTNGNNRGTCRCADKVFRTELTAEEYQKLEGMVDLGKKMLTLAPEEYLKKLTEFSVIEVGQGTKDLDARLAFHMKLAGTAQKIVSACGRV